MNAEPGLRLRSALSRVGVIPVLTIERVSDAVPLARALSRGGLSVLEVTLRTPCALAAIGAIARDVPECLVGAGTLLDVRQVAQVVASGARFAISPGFEAELATRVREHDLPWIPGVATPSEIMTARAAGFELLKLFPAESVGGVPYLQALEGPFGNVTFCPTGGIRAETAKSYLVRPNVLCVGGSWMVSKDALAHERWGEIERAARIASSLAKAPVALAEAP